jgi:periplasmic protein TonB
VFSKVEIEAEFPGGQDAWKQYLNSHLVYPQKAIEKEIMGDVVVEFVVDKSGNVSHVKALSGPQELRTESVRIIKESGKWTPAIQDGQNVNAYRKQPIKYRLERQ